MVFGLPAIGETSWGQKVLDSINAVKATADAAVSSVNVAAHGAVGDGVADDTAAIQSAINAAGDDKMVFLPSGTYKITSALTPGTGPLGYLRLQGAGGRSTELRAAAGYTGYLIRPTASFTISDMTLRGSGVDGSYGIGNAGPGIAIGRAILKHLTFYDFDYGIRFQRVDFSLGAYFADLYMYGVRTCGALFRADVTGGSNYTLDNVIVTNNGYVGYQSISASGVVVTPNSPSATQDSISWSATGACEFGWQVLRKPAGDVTDNAWRWVADVASGTTSYQATKTSGTSYDYAVVRHSQGLYLTSGKGVDVGALQCEYVGTGATFDTCYGVTISALYSETRSTQSQPVPRGNAAVFLNTEGATVLGGWVEGLTSGVHVQASSVSVGSLLANNCERSVVHHDAQGNAANELKLGATSATGTTPATLTTTGGAFDHNVSARTADATENRESVNHPTRSEWEVQMRGLRRAALGSDSTTDAGYLYLSSAALPAPAAAYVGQVRRNGGVLYECVDNGGSSYSWVALVKQVADPDATWVAPTLQNSWANQAGYNPAGYRKDALGVVRLRGAVNTGSTGTVVFTLPTGYRPAGAEPRTCVTSGGFARVDVGVDGTVTVNSAYTTYLSLDGISFIAA